MTEIVFAGPTGRLEGRYQAAQAPDAPIAVVLHPHPLHGGTMNNKVAYTLYHAFVRRGFATVRFNFRGVGKSQGCWGDGEGEIADAMAALDWLQTHNPNASAMWVGGFSFGAWAGMQLLMRRPEIDSFISIAPPANTYDFNFLAPCPSSGLFIQGERDTVVPEPSVNKLVQKLNAQKGITIDYRIIPGAGHFFAEQMDILAGHLDQYLTASFRQSPIALAG